MTRSDAPLDATAAALASHGIDVAAFDRLLDAAIEEDLGSGDRTTRAVGVGARPGRALIEPKQPLVVAGLVLLPRLFARIDRAATVDLSVADGATVPARTPLAHVSGPLGALLAGERVALNLLGHLSGVATTTRRYVDAIAGTRAHVADTRKTLPGLRSLEKYAVRTGGGQNHRTGLYDAVLVKNNHVDAAGGMGIALERLRASGDPGPIEIEVRDQAELEAACAYDPDWILIDNFPVPELARAVTYARAHTRASLEASGGVSLDSIAAIAATGVDRISVGALTHSAAWSDVHMLVEAP